MAHDLKKTLDLVIKAFSQLDCDDVGISRYARHSSTEILIIAYAIDGAPARLWKPISGEAMPQDLLDAILHDRIVRSHDRLLTADLLKCKLGITVPLDMLASQKIATQAVSLPADTGLCCSILGVGIEAAEIVGQAALDKLFCAKKAVTRSSTLGRFTPSTHPDDFQAFCAGTMRELEIQRAIWDLLEAFPVPQSERDIERMDHTINRAGIPVNASALRNAVGLVEDIKSDMISEMSILTGMDNPNSPKQLVQWLRTRGYKFTDAKVGHIRKALKDAMECQPRDQSYIRVLQIRLEVSKTSTSKLASLLSVADADGRIRNSLSMHGASKTGRWSGPFQSLIKPKREFQDEIEDLSVAIERLDRDTFRSIYADPIGALASGVRSTIKAPAGKMLADVDLSAVEPRVLAWVTGDKNLLQIFRDGLDPYVFFAAKMFRGSYPEIEARYRSGDRFQRDQAKPPFIGGGYGLSAGTATEDPETGETVCTGLLAYAQNMGITMTRETADLAIRVYPDTFSGVARFWTDVEAAAIGCVKTGDTMRAGRVSFRMHMKNVLAIDLPSGRSVYYWNPRIEAGRYGKSQLTYECLSDGAWRRVSTHPGQLTQNICQAIARDILAHGMIEMSRRFVEIVLHIHDQTISVVPQDVAEQRLADIIACMTTTPSWGDDDLMLAASGSISKVFRKD